MADVHHFSHGWLLSVLAVGLAFLGSLLGLGCVARARTAVTVRRRFRWLLFATLAIGGTGIWLMHFLAMLGFSVPGAELRYDPWLTGSSLVLALTAVGAGLLLAWLGPASVPRLVAGGAVAGAGVAGMHYTGMAAVRLSGVIRHDPSLVAASVLVAVVATTVALWLTNVAQHRLHRVAAAGLLAAAIAGMHYTGMAAVRVELFEPAAELGGMTSMVLIVPITVLTAAALLAIAFNALQALTEEELDAQPPAATPAGDGVGPVPGPRQGPAPPAAHR